MAEQTRTLISRAWIAAPLLGAALLMGAAGCDEDPPSPSPTTPTPTPAPGPGGSVSVVGGELPEAVHKDLQKLLKDVYGGATLRESTQESGDIEKVFQLEYTLKRAHAEADLEALKTALKGAGYEQHAETPTASASVLVSKSSLAKSEILVSPTSGKTSLSVSITKM